MSTAAYRRMRIAVGGLVLASTSMVFADIGGWIPAAWTRAILWFQFTPSALSLLQGAAWISAGALLVIGLTLLFGRVYCAMLCPLGVLMDLSAWLGRRSGRKRKLPHAPARPKLRILVVALCVGGLLAGSALPLAFLDPYSLWGKISAATLRPLIGEANHGLAAIGWVHPHKWSPISTVTLSIALALLVLIVSLAIWRGRLWCNTVCPVGAVLGFFSRHSLFRLHIAKSACVACSLCERTCPSQCIDFKNHEIDHSRCVMCFNCVGSCKRNGIQFTRRRPGTVSEADEDSIHPEVAASQRSLPAIPRRTVLGAAALAPVAALASSTGRNASKHGGNGKHSQGRQRCRDLEPRPTLPPGARSLEHFQSRCTACHLCVANCPEQVLRPAISEHGLAGFLQPFQDFDASFCSYNCSNCSQVCPTGAIEPISVEERRAVRTGVAHFFRGRCVVKTDGTSCGACNEHCPTQAVYMVPWKDGLTIPEVDPELCIGCGGCEHICPATPKAIIVDGLIVHQEADPVDRGESNTVRTLEDEFPF